jgi:LysM repeat protein
VLAKETKYSIAKRYGITVEELEKRNPEVVDNLPIGYRLTIKGKLHDLKSNRKQLKSRIKR